MSNVTIRLAVHGSTAVTRIILEPWAGEYSIGVSEVLELELTGDPRKPIDLEMLGTSLIVTTFDSAGCEGRVLRDGVELGSE